MKRCPIIRICYLVFVLQSSSQQFKHFQMSSHCSTVNWSTPLCQSSDSSSIINVFIDKPTHFQMTSNGSKVKHSPIIISCRVFVFKILYENLANLQFSKL